MKDKNKLLKINQIPNSSFNQFLHTQNNFNLTFHVRNKIPILTDRTRENNNSILNSFQSNSPHKLINSFYTLDTNFSIPKNTRNKRRGIIYNRNLTPITIKKRKDLNLEEKIFLAQENKKFILEEKNKMFIEEYKRKEKKIYEMRENSQKKKINLMNKLKKLHDMRRLRLKIHKIMEMECYNICNEFESKISNFNIKILDYLSGKHNLNQSIKYQSNFRFDKKENENGEAHNRKKMIIDIDLMKNYGDFSEKILENNLNEKERKLIIEDPNYFFQNNVSDKYKQISLTDRINKEEGDIIKAKNNDINFNKKRSLKDKLSKRLKTDINKNLLDIKKDINKTIYKIKTKDFNNKEDLGKIIHKKIIKNMLNSLKKNYIRNSAFFYENDKKNREKMYSDSYKYSSIGRLSLTDNNKTFVHKLSEMIENEKKNLSQNNFKKEEIDLIKIYKNKIKENYNNE